MVGKKKQKLDFTAEAQRETRGTRKKKRRLNTKSRITKVRGKERFSRKGARSARNE